MKQVLKVFTDAKGREALAQKYRVIERYPGFLLIEAPEEAKPRIARDHLVEDITSQFQIKVGDRVIRPIPSRTMNGKAPVRRATASGAGERLRPGRRHHYLVEFLGPIKQRWLREVRRAGGELRVPYQNFTYVVRANPGALSRIRKLPFVRGSVHLPYWSRIATSLREKRKWTSTRPPSPGTRLLPGTYTVEFFGPEDARRAIPSVRALGLEIVSAKRGAKFIIVCAADGEAARRKQLRLLARVHGVRTIRERALPKLANDVAAPILRGGGPRRRLTRGDAMGRGETVAVCDSGLDTGEPKTIHPDFRGRIVGIRSYAISPLYDRQVKNPRGDDGPSDISDGHGTHVAGSVLGDGAASRMTNGGGSRVCGVAPAARLFFQAIEQKTLWRKASDTRANGRYALTGIPLDVRTLFADAYRKGARIHTNSWSGGNVGAYDNQSEQLDQFVWDHKDFCILVAAGNEGEDRNGNGKIDDPSIAPPATAKNCVTVGACENRRPEFRSEKYGGRDWFPGDFPAPPFAQDPMADNPEQIVPFSSRGPTLDGRIKPDVVAPGTFILSTRSRLLTEADDLWSEYAPNPFYCFLGGTSMATPLVAGAVALLREHLRRRVGIARPSAALLKATLIAGARRIGSLQERRALVDVHQGFGRVSLESILTPRSPCRASFQDVRRGLQTGGVSEWRLRVTSSASPLRVALAYTDFPGKSLVNDLNLVLYDPNGRVYAGNNGPQGRELDHKNNAEVIHVSHPARGEWRLQVIGANVPHGPQDFALVFLGAIGRVVRHRS